MAYPGTGVKIMVPVLLARAGAVVLLFFVCSARGATTRLPMMLSLTNDARMASASMDPDVRFPGERTVFVHSPACEWTRLRMLEFDLYWPKSAPTNAQIVVYVVDWDYYWYQNLLSGYLRPGETNRCRVDLLPESRDWKPVGHYGAWHLRALMAPKEFGVRVFTDVAYEGKLWIFNVVGTAREDAGPPVIRNLRADAESVNRYERVELRFDLPDRYTDPFDGDQISVTARFVDDAGRATEVTGFYCQDFFRSAGAAGDVITPEGRPGWRVRFTPTQPGEYRYWVKARDSQGESVWGPGRLTVRDGGSRGFVRVSRKDPRFFEFDDGSPFYPIGHNIRSPFDERMTKLFPWKQRWEAGASIYSFYFQTMAEHGENFAEIWSAAWSLGLEWSPRRRGYHGIGQFNLIHAWELDRVVEEAERRGIYLNIVIHNHGKFSTYVDEEWDDNPFNIKNGGYLAIPDEYFTDERAHKAFCKLMRYIIARWGYSPHIFAWQLWSEVDLTGSTRSKWQFHQTAEVLEWHRKMAPAVKELDPYDHLISTHVSGDYNKVNKEIIKLPGIDFCAVNGYHYSRNPCNIVSVMKGTARHLNPLGKPALITEFGGTHLASDMEHLEQSLHAALWASPCVPLGGTPLFWWWQLIEEENLYPMYKALNEFLRGEDLRDPALEMKPAAVSIAGGGAGGLVVECMSSPGRAFGWIYPAERLHTIDIDSAPAFSNVWVTMEGMANGEFRVEFWDTRVGIPAANRRATSRNGTLRVEAPPFVRDIAFKARLGE